MPQPFDLPLGSVSTSASTTSPTCTTANRKLNTLLNSPQGKRYEWLTQRHFRSYLRHVLLQLLPVHVPAQVPHIDTLALPGRVQVRPLRLLLLALRVVGVSLAVLTTHRPHATYTQKTTDVTHNSAPVKSETPRSSGVHLHGRWLVLVINPPRGGRSAVRPAPSC